MYIMCIGVQQSVNPQRGNVLACGTEPCGTLLRALFGAMSGCPAVWQGGPGKAQACPFLPSSCLVPLAALAIAAAALADRLGFAPVGAFPPVSPCPV